MVGGELEAFVMWELDILNLNEGKEASRISNSWENYFRHADPIFGDFVDKGNPLLIAGTLGVSSGFSLHQLPQIILHRSH